MSNTSARKASGWVAFAGYLMAVVGIFQMIVGLVAIFQPEIYLTTANNTWALSYTQWGWTHLIIGLVVALSSASLFAGSLWGRIVAIVLASLSAIANFGFIWAYPFWSILIIVMDIFIIYSVAMYGREDEA